MTPKEAAIGFAHFIAEHQFEMVLCTTVWESPRPDYPKQYNTDALYELYQCYLKQ
jgi:hypothetical protein